MLHQIMAPQFYTNFLKLISLVMQSSILIVEINVKISIFHKFSVLENSRKVLENSLNFTHTCLFEPWIMNTVSEIFLKLFILQESDQKESSS